MKKMTLEIAGTSVAIQLDETIAFFLIPLQDFFRGFLKQGEKAAIQLTISYNQRIPLRKFTVFPDRLSQNNDRETRRILHHVERYYPFSGAPLLIGFMNGVLAYNLHSQKGHIYLFRSKGRNYILGSLHKLLFLFIAIVMAEQNMLMIHGAGIGGIKSEGSLFLGASGAGKSTVAGYVTRGDVLSDDAPVVTRDGGLFKIHASPFSQISRFEKKPANHHRKTVFLKKLIFLNQADYTDLKPRDKRSAMAEILQGHIHGFDMMDGDLKTLVFHFCCDLSRSIPAFDLYFQKNNQFLCLL